MIAPMLVSALVCQASFYGPENKSPFFTNYVSEFAGSSGINYPLVKTIDNSEAGNSYRVTLNQPYILEAVIAPHFSLYQSIYDAAMRGGEASCRRGFGVYFTPQVDLRMYGGEITSVPVRRPNYKPHLTLEGRAYFNSDRVKKGVHVVNAEATFIHYSDGQDGCLFVEDSQTVSQVDHVPKRSCEDQAEGTLNTLDGEYTSTYFIAGLGYKFAKVRQRKQFAFVLLNARTEWHPEWPGLFGVEPERQRRIYDRNLKTDFEVRLGYMTKHCLGYVGGLTASTFPLLNRNSSQEVPSYGLDAFLGLTPPDRWGSFVNWSLIGGIYAGQDRMNVDFRKDTFQLHVGLRYSADFQEYALR